VDSGIQDVVVPTSVVEVEVVDAVIQMIVVHFKKGEIFLTGESRMSNVTTAKNTDTMPQNVRIRKMIMSTLLKHQVLEIDNKLNNQFPHSPLCEIQVWNEKPQEHTHHICTQRINVVRPILPTSTNKRVSL
jgi:hypothetical protein